MPSIFLSPVFIGCFEPRAMQWLSPGWLGADHLGFCQGVCWSSDICSSSAESVHSKLCIWCAFLPNDCTFHSYLLGRSNYLCSFHVDAVSMALSGVKFTAYKDTFKFCLAPECGGSFINIHHLLRSGTGVCWQIIRARATMCDRNIKCARALFHKRNDRREICKWVSPSTHTAREGPWTQCPPG